MKCFAVLCLRLFPLCVVIVSLISSSASAAVVYVKLDSPGTPDGKSWGAAYHKVQDGINASVSGGEVWVAAGTYVERITLKAGVGLYGGFVGTENTRTQRNWRVNVTVLDGNRSGSVVTSLTGITATTVIDGFTIRNGNTATNGGGIYCSSSSPTISNNTISGNVAGMGGGIYCTGSSPVIANNIIYGNTANNGGGIQCYVSSSPQITNNTITKNGAANGGGIYVSNTSYPAISNNIVAFNTSGFYRPVGTPTLRNNCVYGNTTYNYAGVLAGTGDVSVDPGFLNRAVGEYHLRPGSPCIDAGYDAAIQAGSTDQDGKSRILGAHADMGCFEWDSTPYMVQQVGQAKAIPQGLDVKLKNKIVTAAFGGLCYIEEPNRSSAMRVVWPITVAVGDVIDVTGRLTLDAGELAAQASSLSVVAHNATLVPKPMGLSNHTVGGGDYQCATDQGQQGVIDGVGLNNVGLLVTTFGMVTYGNSSAFYIDDGSALNDGSGHIGVKVFASGLIIPLGGFVKATGISMCETNAQNKLVRLLRVRTQDDIKMIVSQNPPPPPI